MVGLMDCNNFFVSCERLFRPDLRTKPVTVLSSNDGCIVARSQEVKDIGIPMGAPFFEVKKLCVQHEVTLFSSNFALYRDISARVMAALKEEYESISVYSIDEAFFEVASPFDIEHIRDIRTRIMQKTGIPVSFGIADTKTIAKIANTEAKRGGGVVYIDASRFTEMSSNITCGSVWGIGRETSVKLTELNINTVDDLLRAGLSFMRQRFGVHGERLFFELSGVPASPTHLSESVHASITSSRSFAKILHDRSALKSALGHHIAHVAEKLREQGMTASFLSILVSPSRHSEYTLRKGSAGRELSAPTNDTTVLLKEALSLLDTLYDPEVPYKKAGVTVSGIIPEAFIAKSLFDASSSEKGGGVYFTVDHLNSRFGRGTIQSGTMLGNHAWHDRKERTSPEYTTRWAHIACVKAI